MLEDLQLIKEDFQNKTEDLRATLGVEDFFNKVEDLRSD